MILKLQHVSVFFIKPSSGNKFVPNKDTFTNLLPDDGFIKIRNILEF